MEMYRKSFTHISQDQWLDEFSNWLETFPWQWFCTLTFWPGFSKHQARWRLHKWIDELRNTLGTDNFEWLGVLELGKTQQNLHYHVLVAALRHWHASERLDFMRRWNRFAGDARIEIYEPNRGCVRYILKSIGPDDMDNIEIGLRSPNRGTGI
jgi:hypothetical protein